MKYYFPFAKTSKGDPKRVTLGFHELWGTTYTLEKPHRGVDFSPYAGAYGEPIVLPFDSLITQKSYSSVGCGNQLRGEFRLPFQVTGRDHNMNLHAINPHALLKWRMCHPQELKVKENTQVKAGTVIATNGSTGFSSGAHLHFEVEYDGVLLDPFPILEQCVARNFQAQKATKFSTFVLNHLDAVPLGERIDLATGLLKNDRLVWKGEFAYKQTGEKLDVSVK